MKIFLWIVASLVAGFLLLCVAVALLFDANSFRARISAEVDQSIHRKLTIGEIHIGIFPTLGARIRNAELSNAPGFGDEPMAQQSPSHAPPQPQPQQQSGQGLLIRIGGIDIDNANISYVDQQAKMSYALTRFGFKTGSIAPGKPFDFKLAFSAALADPAINAEVEASATLDIDAASKLFEVQNLEADVSANGQGVPGGKQDLKFSGSARYDGDQGSFKLSNGKLSLANIVASISLDGSGLDGDAGHISGPLSVAAFNPRDTFKALGIEAPRTADANALQQLSLSATFDAVKNHPRLTDLNLKLDQSTLTGSAGLAASAIQFALKIDQLDADRYLAPAARNPVAPQGTGKPGEGDNAPLPLDKLDGFNANGTVDIGKLKLKNLNLANAQLRLAAAKGSQKEIILGASLYGGTLASATRIGPGARPSLAQTMKLASISAGPLLQDFMGKDYVSGTGNVALDVTSAGGSVAELKRALNGTASFALQNGAVKGFNLAQILRQGQAVYSGQQLQQGDSQQTDFSTMSASGKFSNGVLHSDDLSAASPLLRLTGAGQVDLVNNTLDYTAKPTLVNTASGQGGKQLAQLQGVVIPVRVYGPLNAPKYQLDVASALQQEAVQKLTQKLGGQKGSDLVNTLQGLFGKKPQ